MPQHRAAEEPIAIEELAREAMKRALARVGGNRRLADEEFGIGLRTLREKLER